ncbi:MAG: hypothetical protein V2I46_08665 [Bacteroides sp.]|jgi:hypothetical protein|nr:hypothetical protein [Bacteroides sp.]
MKTLKIVFTASLLFVLSLALLSCSKDDSATDNTPAQVEDNFSSGSWKVTFFEEDGVNQTGYFDGYNFSFSTNNTVVATNGSNTVNGTWSTFEDSGSTKFDLNFTASSGPFEEISEDWRVISNSSTKIELRHESGGDGSIDLLTFSRN